MKRPMRLGTNRGKPRLWLEGPILTEHGFLRHEPFMLEVTDKAIRLTHGIANTLKETRRVSGKTKPDGSDHPIIDINGKDLEPFANQDLVLTASIDRIVITRAKK